MNNTVFITGATSGFGLACARKFAAQGWNLVLSGRRQERLQQIASELQHCQVHTLALDVCDTEAVQRAIADLKPPFSTVHTLINNAGLALGTKAAQSSDLQQWHQMVDTNIKGLTSVTHALLPRLIKRGAGTTIINIGSTAGSTPYPGGNVYCGTKAFVEQFSRALRCDVQGTGLRVSCLAPGLSESEFTLVRTGGDQSAHDALYAGADPIQPEDIAEMCWWMASLPKHLNVNALELMPVSQTWSPFTIQRNS